MEMNLRIGWIGFHMEGIQALEALLERGIRISAAITLAEESLAKRSGAVLLDDIAQRYNVPLYKVRHINDPASVALLKSLDLDVAFVIGWSQIVARDALRAVKVGMIGAHAAMLPHNRGSAPVNWAILRGETEGGNTLIWLGENVDEGEMIDQTAFTITLNDTCASVYEKVAQSNRDMILRLLPKLWAGQRPARPQPPTNEPLLPRRRPQDGLIDWSRSSLEVYNFIRGLTRPYPGAFSVLDGARYLIWEAGLLPAEPYPHAQPGQALGPVVVPYKSTASGQVVACGQGAIIVLEVEISDGISIRGQELASLEWKGRIWTYGQ